MSFPYLVLHRQHLHFRVRVPGDLRACLGKTEYRLSLRTSYLREARPVAIRLASTAFNIFDLAREVLMRRKAAAASASGQAPAQGATKKESALAQLTDERIREIAGKWLRDTLQQEHAYRLVYPRDPETREKDDERLSLLEMDAAEAADHGDFSPETQEWVGDVLKAEGVEVVQEDRSTVQFRKACFAMKLAEAAAMEQLQRPAFDGTIKESRWWPPYAEKADAPAVPVQTAAPVPEAPMLSEVVDKYIAQRSHEWSKGSQVNIPPLLQQFVTIVQRLAGKEIRVSELTRELVTEYSLTMAKLPKHPQKKKEFRGKDLLELASLDLPPEQRLSGKTLDTHFTMIRSFINWAELEESYGVHAKKLNKSFVMPKGAATSSDRRAFTLEELKALFYGPAYTGRGCKESWQFWVPVVGLYTGMRLEEICQLRLDDIRQEEGVWVFDINDKDGKTIKSRAAKRLVPVHPFLLDKLRLLDFVDLMRECQSYIPVSYSQRLFPSLRPVSKRGNVGHMASKWFLRYRRECGVGGEHEQASAVVFHSFRHTIVTQLVFQKKVDLKYVQKAVGHEFGEEVGETRNYLTGNVTRFLRDEVIALLDFHETVGLDHLTESKWVVKRK